MHVEAAILMLVAMAGIWFAEWQRKGREMPRHRHYFYAWCVALGSVAIAYRVIVLIQSGTL